MDKNQIDERMMEAFRMKGANPGKEQAGVVALEATTINDQLALLTQLYGMHTQEGSYLGDNTGVLERLQKHIGFYDYFRDTLNATTVKDVHRMLSERKVNPRIVELWIEEGFLADQVRLYSTKRGYPEYSEKLEEAQIRVRKEILGE